jgi:integrase
VSHSVAASMSPRCSASFDLAGHPARERDLKVKRDKPDYRRYLEADEILDLLDAALEVDQRVSAETAERAREVRRLRDDLHLRWSDVASPDRKGRVNRYLAV